ncbi:MAG TPA: MotA/TolQ/ExbB proton channel family protein [Pirellulales bacterium]|nr:MotA/TolQ/ExbB proton channel family protein [Pirellulales bacterium]
MNVNHFAKMLGDACYIFLALNGLWGLYCFILLWRRLGQLSFRSSRDAAEFVDEVQDQLLADSDAALAMCEDDDRALPQLAREAIFHGDLEQEKLRGMLAESFQQQILSDLEHRMSWIATVIKSGPLLGLFGTVLGMMAAFGRIGSGEKVEPAHIAHEISIALICTAMGLVTAIPLNFLLSAGRIRVQKLQESVSAGMSRLLDTLAGNSPEQALAAGGGRR